jgi:hypothetical protein
MTSYISENHLLESKFELFIEQLIILNQKINNLEEKIDNFKNNYRIIIPSYINNINNNDWESIIYY